MSVVFFFQRKANPFSSFVHGTHMNENGKRKVNIVTVCFFFLLVY